MINIAICDGDENNSKKLREKLTGFFNESLKKADLFDNPQKLLKKCKSEYEDYDIIFLEYNYNSLRDYNGLRFCEELKKLDRIHTKLVFITDETDFRAVQDVLLYNNCIAYISKESIDSGLDKYKHEILKSLYESNRLYYNFKKGGKEHRIKFLDILYIENDQNYVNIYFDSRYYNNSASNSKSFIRVRKNIDSVWKEAEHQNNMAQINQGTIVNIIHTRQTDEDKIIVCMGKRDLLTISGSYYINFLDRFKRYHREQCEKKKFGR